MRSLAATLLIFTAVTTILAQDETGAAKKNPTDKTADNSPVIDTVKPTKVSTSAPEITPVTLPGAEIFIYRDSKPEPLRLHVFKPKNWQAGDRRPALIWFFGGGWDHGTPENSAGWAKWAASLGFVGVAPDYRTKKRFSTSPLEAVADGRAAMHWVEDHAAELGVDANRIVVCGNSAGGHLAL